MSYSTHRDQSGPVRRYRTDEASSGGRRRSERSRATASGRTADASRSRTRTSRSRAENPTPSERPTPGPAPRPAEDIDQTEIHPRQRVRTSGQGYSYTDVPGGSGGRGKGAGGSGGGGRGPGGRGPGGRGPGGSGPGDTARPEKTGWRRYVPSLRVVVATFGIAMIATGVMLGIAYANTPIPSANKAATAQASTIYYRDGKTKIATIGTYQRTLVKICPRGRACQPNEVPVHVQDAVVAAENKDFWTEAGVSPTGMVRALWSTVTGQQVQGASTITQQLARNYYEGFEANDRSPKRKIKEIFVAIKVNQQYDKPWILENYLNTVYFGKGAHGIDAAAQAYFRVPAAKLTREQGAYLAGMIQRPEFFNRKGNEAWVTERFHYVIKAMSELDPATYGNLPAAAKQPVPAPAQKDIGLSGFNGYIVEWVKEELEARDPPISWDDDVKTKGYRIITTIDHRLMNDAKAAVEQFVTEANRKKGVHGSLAAVDPKSGQVLAFYGGPGYEKQQINIARQASKQSGSAWKPYVLAAWLENDWSLDSHVKGEKCITEVEGKRISGPPVCNAGRKGYGVIDLTKATASSVNTIFAKMGDAVGPENVAALAEKAGISKEGIGKYREDIRLSIGIAQVTAVQQAGGYATFANDGKHIKPHVVWKVQSKDGKSSVYPEERKSTTVVSAGVAADVTHALRKVVTSGTGRAAALYDRPVAGKTGTTDGSKEAWFIGYISQMSTAVGVYGEKGTGAKAKEFDLDEVLGRGVVSGGSFPARIWRTFMQKAVRTMNYDREAFPPPARVGQEHNLDEPEITDPCDPDYEGDEECKDEGDGGGPGDGDPGGNDPPNKPCKPWQPLCRPEDPPPPTEEPQAAGQPKAVQVIRPTGSAAPR